MTQQPPLQQRICEALKVKPQIDVQAEIKQRIGLLKDYLTASNTNGLVLGLSGGVDSSVAGRLSQLACEQLNQQTNSQRYKFVGVRLPYGQQADEDDAQAAIAFVQPDEVATVNIKAMVDASEAALTGVTAMAEYAQGHRDFVKGNTKARARMVAQYQLANLMGGLVVGTDHSAEAITGFFTKHGDGACDIVPLFGLNKRQVRSLATALGAAPAIANKKPTADLEDLRPGLLDEDALGVSYDDIDDYLEGKTINQHSQQLLETRFLATQHKREDAVSLYTPWWQ